MEKQDDGALRGGFVIVVDDDAAVRNSLRFSLEVEGFGVRAYASGTELLNDTELAACGCLIVDQNMPEMNGFELIAELRARKVSVPAILITSHPNRVLSERAARAGIPIVEKPFLSSALLDGIRQAMAQPHH